MDLIFVSTDGVLSNQNYLELISKRGINYMSVHQNQIDKEKVGLLNHLANKSGASFVFTGYWKDYYSLERLNEMIKKSGANWKAIDSTPYLFKLENGKSASKEDEVLLYMQRLVDKGITVKNFIILDDHLNNYRAYSDNLVKVNYERGLRPFHIEKALELLGVERKRKIVNK